ncbi:MAG TPA: hypothetical protein VFH85_08610 [Gammaproteobacteria bacterium]|nr:hypothetical protein [Gammaproteobacteria bacterium]
MSQPSNLYDSAAQEAVDLANGMADSHPDADLWDIADGMLAGAVHYWLFANRPCGDPRCEDCVSLSTPEGRVAELKRLITKFAEESDYYHSPDDLLSGHA